MSLTQKHYYRRYMHITCIIPSYLNTWPNLTDLRTHAFTIKTQCQHLEIYITHTSNGHKRMQNMNKPLTERYAAFRNTILASTDNWNPPEYSKSKQSSSVSICWYCGWSTASLTDTLLITGNWVPKHTSRIWKKNRYRVSVLQKSTPPNKR